MNVMYRIALLLFLAACNKENAPDFMKTAGETRTETRDLPFFDAIDLDDNVNLILFEDSLTRVEVRAGKNLLKKVTTVVTNKTLKIRNENKWNFMRSYKNEIDVLVYSPWIKNIAYEGGGDIKSGNTLSYPQLEIVTQGGGSDVMLDLQCDSLKAIIHTGVSNLYFTGFSDYAYFYSNGLSIFHAEQLQCDAVHVNNASTGDFFVHALSSLIVEIRSYSTTWYRGNPIKSIYKASSGEVLPLP